jgi:hypothetical protein
VRTTLTWKKLAHRLRSREYNPERVKLSADCARQMEANSECDQIVSGSARHSVISAGISSSYSAKSISPGSLSPGHDKAGAALSREQPEKAMASRANRRLFIVRFISFY